MVNLIKSLSDAFKGMTADPMIVFINNFGFCSNNFGPVIITLDS